MWVLEIVRVILHSENAQFDQVEEYLLYLQLVPTPKLAREKQAARMTQ
jgi:hypothetical protein